jgi:hypothetical protein
VRAFKDPVVSVTRRKFVCAAPSSLIASAMPAAWHPASVVKPSSAERIDTFVSGRNIGLISASRADLTREENRRRSTELWTDILRRLGSIDVDYLFTEWHGFFHTETVTERAYLLLGERRFDGGNLKGFLRQYGAIYDQRLVLYKPYDDERAKWCGLFQQEEH